RAGGGAALAAGAERAEQAEAVDPRRVAVGPGRLERVASHQGDVLQRCLLLGQILRLGSSQGAGLPPLAAAPGAGTVEAQQPPGIEGEVAVRPADRHLALAGVAGDLDRLR